MPPGGPPSSIRTRPLSVLVVDDDVALLRLVTSWLESAAIPTVEATSGPEAIEVAQKRPDVIDAIVLDVMMPGMDGMETLSRLKADPRTRDIPVIVLTAHANRDQDIVRGVERGAVDHIAKPFSGPVLIAKVRAVAERGRVERQLRSDLRFAQENATVDVLTRLANRRHFDVTLRQELAHARRHEKPITVVLFDLDHFKEVNDTFGHQEGDRVLIHVAEATQRILRKEDSAFRYGGEEFVLVLRNSTTDDGVRVAERLREELTKAPIQLGEGEERVITFSAGVATVDQEKGWEDDELLVRADQALYRAKRSGRNRTERAALEPTRSSPP